LTAPPIDGRANHACIEFFAKLLKVPRSSVTIASGQSSRNKVIRVAGLTRPMKFVRRIEIVGTQEARAGVPAPQEWGATLTFSERLHDIRTGFERPFWVANISELFERLSYYAVFAVLARYLHEKPAL
jgi:hypothetical protein